MRVGLVMPPEQLTLSVSGIVKVRARVCSDAEAVKTFDISRILECRQCIECNTFK